MATAISKDGTKIAFSIEGAGPSVLLVDGAMCHRNFGPVKAIAEALGPDFQVYYYDRRGRGESGDASQWDVDREIEDIAAMIEASGDEVYLFGISSGAILAAMAAKKLKGIRKLALFEGPMVVDDTYPALDPAFLPRVKQHIAEGRPGDAVKMFLKRVGMPGFAVWFMSLTPVWKKMKAIGPTLPSDLTIVAPFQQQRALVADDWADITMPTLVIDGGKSPQYMRNAQKQWAGVLPNADYKTLPGETHMVKPGAIAPVLKAFFHDSL